MSVNKPTTAQLTEWEALLEAEGLGHPEKDLNFVTIRDTDGVRIPAQPAREGGVFWRERAAMYETVERRLKPKLSFVCPECSGSFAGTKRAKFCSTRCRMRSHRRYANLTVLSEETAQ